MKPELTPLEPFKLEEERCRLIAQASKLEWITIVFMTSVVILMYLVAGQSQSMRAALLEDVLSLIPPIAFLLGSRYARKDPTEWFPYGFRRATLIAYLAASVALVVLGLFSFYEAATALAKGSRPSFGLMSLFGFMVWEGWVMVVVLAYSAIPPVFLGKAKSRLAEELGDPTLQADAATNRADWLTGLAAALGVLGAGMGWWWSDAAMALMISVDIVRDGTVYLRNAVGVLMDRAPSEVCARDKPHPVIQQIREYVTHDLGLEVVEFRLRSIGLFITGYLSVRRTPEFDEEELSETISREFPQIHDLNVAYRNGHM